MGVKATFKSSHGKLSPNTRDKMNKFISSLNGREFTVTIEKVSVKRSTFQNAFYWGVFILSQRDCFKERWGETYLSEQIHDWNKANIWCTEKINEATGEVFKIPDTSTKWNKLEWEERMDICRTFFLNNFDWKLPYPNEEIEMF